MNDATNYPDKRKRRRHFRRQPEFKPERSRAGRLELRRRDLDIITAIALRRFLNAAQVCRLFACDCPRIDKMGMRGGKPSMVAGKQHRVRCACTCEVQNGKSEHAKDCLALFKDDKHVKSRLLELYQAGYLERPVTQLQLRVQNGVITTGSVPMVYCVTHLGLGVIGEERRLTLGHGKMSWASKINEGTRVFMEHTLAIADVSIGVDLAVRARPHTARLSEAALHAGLSEQRRKSMRPWSLAVDYRGIELSTVCDLVFVVGDVTRRKRYNYMVEIDLASMPVERASLQRTSIMRKLIGYARAHEEGLHKDGFGWQNFRVLILTTSAARVNSCIAAARKKFGEAAVGRIFLFGTREASRDMLGYEFIDIDGRRSTLLG